MVKAKSFKHGKRRKWHAVQFGHNYSINFQSALQQIIVSCSTLHGDVDLQHELAAGSSALAAMTTAVSKGVGRPEWTRTPRGVPIDCVARIHGGTQGG
jgi:hypothetical protein